MKYLIYQEYKEEYNLNVLFEKFGEVDFFIVGETEVNPNIKVAGIYVNVPQNARNTKWYYDKPDNSLIHKQMILVPQSE